ncbi:MAG: CBS domain-containing protein [Deltaproteobacteria bacterium]|nr:CBS domain-containing protein [Deltaproteobacteria bacterium]
MMTRRVCVADPEEDYRTGLAKMRNTNCRHLPLVRDGKPIGMVSMRDLLDHQLSECRFDVQMLEKYITS